MSDQRNLSRGFSNQPWDSNAAEARNQYNINAAGLHRLGIRTSTDVFRATQSVQYDTTPQSIQNTACSRSTQSEECSQSYEAIGHVEGNYASASTSSPMSRSTPRDPFSGIDYDAGSDIYRPIRERFGIRSSMTLTGHSRFLMMKLTGIVLLLLGLTVLEFARPRISLHRFR